MKLLYSPASPFARKVRVAAIELGIELELVFQEVAPGKPNADYARVNPLRKIPALQLDDGGVLFDSTVICEYLDAQAGGGKLLPAAGPARWAALTRHALAQGMCDAAILYRYETFLRPEPQRWQVWTDDQMNKVLTGADWFEQHAETLAGALDLSLITLGTLLGYLDLRFPDIGWRQGRPRLAAWFEQVEARPSFAETRPPR